MEVEVQHQGIDPEFFRSRVKRIAELEEKAIGHKRNLKIAGKRLVLVRFEQGLMASEIMKSKGAEKYGENLMGQIAKEAGRYGPPVGRRTLYKWRKRAEDPPWNGRLDAYRAWVNEKLKEKGRITSTYVHNYAKKYLREHEEEEKSLDEQLEERKNDLLERANKTEGKAKDLEEEAEDLEKQLQSHNGQSSSDDLAEVRGMAYKVREVAQDLKGQTERMQVKGEGRIESRAYLDWVKEHDCCVCHAPAHDPHHIEGRGTAVKTHDFFTIPLCRTHHDEWEDHGQDTFCEKHQLDPWKEVSHLMLSFIIEQA